MELVLRLAALCLVGALLAVVLKRTGPDMGLLLALAVCGAGLALLLEPLGALRDFWRRPPDGETCPCSCSHRWSRRWASRW